MIIATPVAVLVCGYVGSSIGHFIDGILFSRRKGRRNRQPAVEGSPVVALGVLSTAYSFGCQQWKSRTRCHGTGEHARLRRERLRHEFRTSAAKERGAVAMRFLLAGACGNTCSLEPYARRPSPDEVSKVLQESKAEGDIELLPMQEDLLGGCSRKYLLWLQMALVRYPRALYIGLADDDVFIQFDHFAADLERIRSGPMEKVYWGQMFWRPFYDNVSLSVAEGWKFVGNLRTTDAGNVKYRLKMERCREALAARISPRQRMAMQALRNKDLSRNLSEIDACSESKLPIALSRLLVNNSVSDMAPTPMANGPLFAVSRRLASILTAKGSVAWRWLDGIKQTPMLRWARSRKRIPYVLLQVGCWPFGDATFGYWVASLAYEYKVTLVNVPLLVSFHATPWQWNHQVSNSTIALHGLKDNATDHIWRGARERSAGPYEPPKRQCGSCEGMGWVTWPTSPLGHWRCCGERHKKKKRSASGG